MKATIYLAIIIATFLSGILLWNFGFKGSEQHSGKEKTAIYHLRFGHNIPKNSAMHEAALKFAAIVKKRSSGKVIVEVFPNQQLGNDHQMVEAARKGKLDIILTPTAKLSTLSPSMQYADLPFLFPSPADAYYLLDGEPGKLLLDKLKPLGLIGVAFWENGFKQFTANRRIRTPKDFMGLKIRVMKSRIIMEQFRAFNANPIPIDFHSTYQALKDGVVDGQENPLVAIVNMRFYEVQPYLTISNHALLGYVFSFSKATFERLPSDIQNILLSAVKKVTPFQRAETQKREELFIQKIKQSGTKIYTLSYDERKQFESATRHIIINNKSVIGEEILDKTEQYLREKYHYKPENALFIGLDADMSLASAKAGIAIRRGIELAINEINAQGGLLGKKVNLLEKDHSGISARGVANIRQFAKEKNLIAVMGGKHSPVVLSELNTIHKNRIVFLIPWAAATSVIDNGFNPNYVFRVSVRDELAGEFLVKQALQVSNRIALLLENTGWGRSNHKSMVEALARRKISPTKVEWFNWGEKNMIPQLKHIEESGAELILLVSNSPEGINIVKSMAMRSKKIPIISHWGIVGGNFWTETRKELTSINLRFLQTFSFISTNNPKAKKLGKAYLKAYNIAALEDIDSPTGIAHAYDLMQLLFKAIKTAKSFNSDVVRTALENIASYQGVVKKYAPPFTAQRHDAIDQSDFFMAKYDDLGHIVPIE